jgi:hypothetical protein
VQEFWDRFRLDPRDPANGALRAADADREVVRTVLAEAYADGRLTREEYDERLATVLGAVTLADLPPIVADLVPSRALVPTAASLDEQARAAFARRLRDDVGGVVFLAIVVIVIWFFTGHGFFWPIFPILGVGLKSLDTLFHRSEIIEKERAKLEKRRRKELGGPDRPQDPA